MANEFKKKYGLFMAICMVIGIVVGSGVFFKAEKILKCTGGNLKLGILSWVIGGVIMVICAYTFSLMATRHEKVNGIVDYAEAYCGGNYAYIIGWFMTTIYYPTLTMALAWVSARYTIVLINNDELTGGITGGLCLALTCFYLVASYAVNALSPIIAGKFQISATVIKLIPLLLMAIVGTVFGLSNGMTVENFTTVVEPVSPMSAIFKAVCATAFAYEGWIIATSINAELKDAKKNLPKALVGGTIAIVIIYVLYYIGLAGGISNQAMMDGGEAGAKSAFSAVFGRIGGTALFVFVIISCLGTLNGLMLGCSRGMYSLAARGRGPSPKVMGTIDNNTNMAANSSILGLIFCGLWLVFFYCGQLSGIGQYLKFFAFDPTELPIITIYAFYFPIFINMMIKGKGFNFFQRFIAPVFALLGSAFMIVAAIYAHGKFIIGYLIIFAVITAIGLFFIKPQKVK
jgi:APA family basic amino acid/polyamine antiporter